jgi:hypothetical protein
MGEKCEVCGRDLRDDTNVCEGGLNIRAIRAEEKVALLRGVIEGWQREVAGRDADIELLRAGIQNVLDHIELFHDPDSNEYGDIFDALHNLVRKAARRGEGGKC